MASPVRDVALAARPGVVHGRLYFAVQAATGLLWWVLVFSVPGVRTATLGDIDPVLMALFDLPLFVGASLVAALGLRAGVWIAAPWTIAVAAGMVVYATVSGDAGWGALFMVAAAGGSVVAALLIVLGRLPVELLVRGPFAFRAAPQAARRVHVGRTAVQIVGFWGLFLAVIPAVIVALESRWQLQLPVPADVRVAGVLLLVGASALGIWSAVTMSTRGSGTPLPSATARELVISGPYRFVRNPMAVAGIAQGVGVGLAVGSWLVVVYALCGSIVWNALVRPLEEADLSERFGTSFDDYCARVACWVPHFRRP